MNHIESLYLKTVLFVLLSMIMIYQFSCKSVGEINTNVFQPRWIEDVPLTSPSVSDYVHDNLIYETEHFLVYSDAADDHTKIQFANMAEQAYQELKSFFLLSYHYNFTIQRDDPTTKIQIICNRNDPRSQRSFFYGFMLYTIDSPYCFATEENLYREIKHELVHVFQMYLDGSSRRYEFGWFREGLAEYAADGGFFSRITTLAYFNQLRNILDNAGIHPLKIRWSELRNHEGEVHAATYSMSGLAMHYLLDPSGSGKSVNDIRQLFSDLLHDETLLFETAFENNMGIDVHDFEDQFYDVMPGYLD